MLSDSTAAYYTENPRDKILYRLRNNQEKQDIALGVTQFKIRYFDSLGNETTDFSQIKSFEITLAVESTIASGDRYSNFYWQTRISPPNLTRF